MAPRSEARSDDEYHAYNCFEAVSRKRGELERPRRAARHWLFRGSLFVAPLVSIGALSPQRAALRGVLTKGSRGRRGPALIAF